MEERKKRSGGFFDDNLMVDQEIVDPLQIEPYSSDIEMHPFDNGHTRGYIRYRIQGKSVIILDCVMIETRP